ncbi:hypothetical protein [Geobacillus thermodenitrificans]|uniref:hypothetical protein n=1 Tax=Geobacillus thermodenitrificans TaxID=33940 RepID=UPI00142EC5D3|nr:hypothetical protein [Geobacillus thermodenitrificans]
MGKKQYNTIGGDQYWTDGLLAVVADMYCFWMEFHCLAKNFFFRVVAKYSAIL